MEDSHIHVPLNDELIKLLVSDDPLDHIDAKPVDWRTTHWDFNTNQWVITYLTMPAPTDPFQDKLAEINNFIALVNTKLQIPDLPSSMVTTLNNYVAQLQALIPTVTVNNCASIIVPLPPI